MNTWPLLPLLLALALPGGLPAQEAAAPRARLDGPLLRRALEGPLKGVREIVFAARGRYDDPHWYANVGYYCGDASRKAYAGNGKPDTGRLCKVDLQSGRVGVIFDARGGSVRDPQVHYDGRRILFSLRKAGTDVYHLYEICSDGTGLRQITDGPWDDYEATYLPDDDIVFVSTRCRRWVNCWMTQVGVMYRCDPQGGSIRLVSANTEHDNTPWVMPDGRILYTRWEYVDRSQVDFHHLWTMFPDGSGHAVYYGNMRPGVVMIDAKPVPGSDKVLANFSPGHGVSDHAGIATLVSPSAGPDDPGGARPLHKGKLVKDPFPFSEDCVLAAQDRDLVLIDGRGGVESFLTVADSGGVHEPRPLVPRPREPVPAPRAKAGEKTGRFVLADVNEGRNLGDLRPGDVRKLLVLESLPKPVNFSGGPDVLTWLGTFTLERVLGTVPVEADGSAYFEAPAQRQIFFVSLDAEDRSLKRMQSFASVAPGETLGCVGCHERRGRTPSARGSSTDLLALQRPPSRIEPFAGFPDVVDMKRDVQPVLDRHCVACHRPERREGHVLLTGDMGPHWSHGYYALLASRQVADGRNGYGNQPPRSIGSSASPLLSKLDGGHHGARLSPQERRLLWLWIESGATFAGTYAALRNDAQQQTAAAAVAEVFAVQKPVLERRCASCHALGGSAVAGARPLPYRRRFGEGSSPGRSTAPYERIVRENDPLLRYSENILLNFTAPAASPLLLAPLARSAGGWESCGPPVFAGTDDPDFRALCDAVDRGRRSLEDAGNFGSARFRPNAQYLREMLRYGVLTEKPGAGPFDVFATDRTYWRSLWD